MRILLGTDGSPSAGVAAGLIAGVEWPSGTEIRIVEAIQPVPTPFTDPWQPLGFAGLDGIDADAGAAARTTVEAVSTQLEGRGFELSTSVAQGRAASVLLDAARTMGADLLVVGSRGHGSIESMVLGSVSSEVVDHATAPVLVARRPALQRVVLAWDGSQCARAAAGLLESWPMFRSAAVRVVSVAHIDLPWWTGFPGGAPQLATMSVEAAEASRRHHAELAAAMASELTALGIDATADPREGDPAAQIIAAATASDADLILVGTHGRTGLGRLLLGSVARNVLHHAATSVLVVRDMACQPEGPRGERA